jgi:hypothetical protein
MVGDRHGKPRWPALDIEEWFGGMGWVPTPSPHPSDPTDVWVTATAHELLRLTLNYNRSSGQPPYRVRAVHRFTELTYPAVIEGSGYGVSYIGRSTLRGELDWQVQVRGTTTYLVRRGAIEVLRVVDGDNASGLEVVAVAQPRSDLPWHDIRWPGSTDSGDCAETGSNDCVPVFTWTKGADPAYKQYLARDPESGPRSDGATGNNMVSLHSPSGFEYFRMRQNNNDPGHPRLHRG